MKQWWNKSKPLVALGVVVLVVSACGSSSSSSSSTHSATSTHSAAGKTKIGFVNLSNGVPYAVVVENGVLAAAKQLGVQVVTCDSALTVPKAISCVQSFTSEGVQGIAEYQQDQAAAPRVCAAGPNVPVVAVDIEQPPCQKVFVGDDNFSAGHVSGVLLGTYAKTHWSCKADAFLNVNTTVNPGLVQRQDGEIAGFKAYCPNVKVVNVTPTTTTTDATIAPFTDTLSRFPGAHRLLVAASNDDMGIGAVRAAESAGRLGDIYVTGQGADPTAYPYICKTTPFKNWLGDANYNPQNYGKLIVPALIKLIQHQTVPKQEIVTTLPLTPANIRSVFPGVCK